MKFHKEIRFEAPLADVYAMLGDAAFREKVASEAGADSYDVTVTPNGADGFASIVETRQSSKELPGLARKFLGDEYTIRQEEHWASENRAELDVTVTGKPGGTKGTPTLTPSGDGTVQTTEAEIKVGIPLLGGKVETLLGKVLGNLLKLQGRVGADWLAGNR